MPPTRSDLIAEVVEPSKRFWQSSGLPEVTDRQPTKFRQLGLFRSWVGAVREIMGHVDERMTEHYSVIALHEKRTAAEALADAVMTEEKEAAELQLDGLTTETNPTGGTFGGTSTKKGESKVS